MTRLMWLAGAIQLGIVLANFALPRMLHTRDGLASVPTFLRQVFYVHWLYIVIVVSFFSVLSFGFSNELCGTSSLGKFLSAFIASFWLLRIALQLGYYDGETRRRLRGPDAVYTVALIALVGIFGWAALHPMK